jgi:hypothetical protein
MRRYSLPDLHREVIRRAETGYSSRPSWYALWLGEPHGKNSELLGRTERLPRGRWWRVFPVTGEYPETVRG